MDHPVDHTAYLSRLVGNLLPGSVLILFSGDPIWKSADETYPFHANRNFVYVTGVEEPGAALVVEKAESEAVTASLFLKPPDAGFERWNGKMLTFAEAADRSGIARIEAVGSFEARLNRLLQSGAYESVYLDLERPGWHTHPTLANSFAEDLRHRHPHVRLRNAFPLLAHIRRVKSAPEVDRIREAVERTREAYEAMLRDLRPGVMEHELEAPYLASLRRAGTWPGYPSIIATGPNATVMHYITLGSRVSPGDVVLVDAAAEWDGYKADITRSFPADGRFTERQRRVYDVVLAAADKTIAEIRPGVAHARLNEVTRATLADGLKDLGIIHEAEELDRYYFYNVSHYLGLDTHDVGTYDVLEPGMVLTVEPGLYITEEGLGIRLEDDVVVTETGAKVLSEGIPRTPETIEAWMARVQGHMPLRS